MSALGRGGVVIAMSSGLVATMGLPAQAVSNASGPETAAAPAAAPASAAPAGAAFTSASLTAAPSFQASAPLTAPAAATVNFESGSYSAIPKPKAAPVRTAGDTASGSSSSSKSFESADFGSSKGASVLSIASRYIGVAYRYGGTTPSGGWDCSGAVRYIFGQVGISLPRTANQQMLATTRVSRSSAKPGDLLFFVSGGSAYHVGIYAGGNMMYDSGRTGKTFSKREIWSSSVIFGRV
jgi:cell wall-associated NlpC family hydrolase